MKDKRRKILSAVSLHHACNDASVVALPVLFPILYTKGELIRSYSDIGTIILVGLGVAVFFQLLIGHKVKVRHYRCCLAVDAAVVGIFLILITMARSYLMLVLFFIGIRIGTSIYHPTGIAWISHSFSGNKLDRAMGIQSAFGDIGVLAAFTTTGFLAEHFGWSTPLLVWGAINFAAIFAGLMLSRGTMDDAVEAESRESVSWGETFRSLRVFIIPFLLGGISWGITLGYAPSLLNHKLNLSMTGTGVVLGCWIGAGALSSLSYGRIAARFGRARTVIAGYSLMGFMAAAVGLSGSVPATVAAMMAFGMALFITYPALLSFVGSSVERRNRTAAFSIVSNIQILGNSVFSFIAGFMSDAFGIHTPFLMLAGIVAGVVLYLYLIMRRGALQAAPSHVAAKPRDIVAG